MEHTKRKFFSKREQGQLLAAIEASLVPVYSTDDFRVFIREHVRPLVPHGMMIAAVGRLTLDALRIESIVGVDYPDRFLAQIKRDIVLSERPLVSRWLKTRKPVVIDPLCDSHLLSEVERREIEEFNLGNLAIHGHVDICGRMGTYLSFAQVPSPLTERYGPVLEVLAPHIHSVFVKALRLSTAVPHLHLSQKENEVLRWVVQGKTNREIAVILNKSELTVRNQLHNLFGKLGAAPLCQDSCRL